MRDQLLLLADVQLLDNRLQSLRGQVALLPQQLHTYEQACTQAREELAVNQSVTEDAEQKRRALERELVDDQDRLVKTQHRLHDVKTNKEYSAVLAEIDTGKQRITEVEDRILDLMEAMEQHRQAHQVHEQKVQKSSRELDEQVKEVEAAQNALTQEIEGLETERQELFAQVDTSMSAAYEKASSRNAGVGVVRIKDGNCGGCYLRIQPQLVSEARKQEMVVTCPHCLRILLWSA